MVINKMLILNLNILIMNKFSFITEATSFPTRENIIDNHLINNYRNYFSLD